MRLKVLAHAALWGSCMVGTANAAIISSLVGDKDGFGGRTAEAVPIGVDTGSGFNNTGPGDPAFHDAWIFHQNGGAAEDPSFVHSYALTEPAVTATFFINESGMGDGRGPWSILFNGVEIGSIGTAEGGTTAELFSFNVDTALLTGNDLVQLVFDPSINPNEGYAINYTELQINTVPIPAAAWLFASGLGILGWMRRKKNV